MRSSANIVRKKPWVTAEILDLCDKRRELRKKRIESKGSEKYKEVNKNIERCMKTVKGNWIGEHCSETEENLRKNNSKRAYQPRERLDYCETRENYYCPRSYRKMPLRRTVDTETMDRILL